MTSPSALPRRRAAITDFALFGLALVAIGSGLYLFWSARAERVVHEAEAGTMWLRVENAEWVRDGMLHPGTAPFGMPAPMMAGLPAETVQRLNVEFSVENRGAGSESFNIAELSLHAESGAVWEALPEEDGAKVQLGPQQRYAAVVQFDVPEQERSQLTLWWKRGAESTRMLALYAPLHEKPAATPRTEWPASVEALPPGRLAEGRLAYQTRFACASCHGDPALPLSNTVGPSLEGFAVTAAARVPNQSALDYAYESILAPNVFIAPTCARGEPCARPSAMPVYSELMSPQDMSDVLQFLMSQRLAQRQ